jgi:hypothetical protein
MTAEEVLGLIDPVDPDSLQATDPSHTEWVAKWHPPVLEMDIEVLKLTPCVTITRDAYEPENLPGWVAVHFTVTPNDDMDWPAQHALLGRI